MKKFSKLFWVALVVVAVLACTAIGVFAAETESTAVVYADSVEVTDTNFSVDFKFEENNTAVECGKITLTWDSTKMTVKSIEKADALNGAQFGTKIENGEAVVAWAGSEIDEPAGTLFTVNFENVSIADGDYAFVNVEVDNFGYTIGSTSKELKDSVTAKNFLTVNGSVAKTYDAGSGDLETFLDGLVPLAAAGQEVTVTLGKDMVFDKYTVIGTPNEAAAWAEGGKISIKSDGTYGIEIQNKAAVVMYGHYEFSDMVLRATEGAEQDNCLVFPDDSSAVFGTGLIAESGKWLNIAGNVTVNSGKYYFVAGNCKGSNVTIKKELNITMQDSAVANYVVGGMFNGTGTGAVNAKANVQVLDNVTIWVEVQGSGRFTGNDGTAGAEVLVNTTVKVPAVTAIVGTLTEASVFDIRIAGGTVTDVRSAYSSGNTAVGVDGTTINWRLDGGAINKFNGGLNLKAESSANLSFIKGNINVFVNERADENIVYGSEPTIATLYSGSADLNGATGVVDYANRNVKIYAGTTISGVLYGGSALSTAESAHKGDTEITIYGGTFNNRVYGGSYATATCTHSGDVTLNVYGGTFNNEIFGGSLLSGQNSAHGKYDEETGAVYGDVTVTLRPAEGVALSVGNVYGGSNISTWGSQHWGNTTVYLKDINTRGQNTQTGSLQTTIADKAYICGGSLLWNSRVHSGNSELIIQRCNLKEDYLISGGSRVDGSTAYHSGTSKLIIDGNTGLVQDAEGNYTDEEVEGTNGYNNLYEKAVEGWFGGSVLIGSGANQTGESGIEIIGPEDEDTTSSFHMTQMRGAWDVGIYGGCYYANANVTLPQQGNSYVKITGNVRTESNNGVYAVGGSLYNTNPFTNYTGTFVPSSRVIIDGDFTGRVIGGFRTKLAENAANATFKHNSAVTLMSGSLSQNWICPFSHQYQGLNLASTSKQQGDALVEIYSGFYADNGTVATVNYNSGLLPSGGKVGLKLIGEFEDTDNSGEFKLILSGPTWHYLDLVQATGDSVGIYRSNGTQLFTGEDAVITRVNTGKNIYFTNTATELTNGKLPANKQVDVNPTMTFADLLGKTGLKISNESTTSTTGNTLLDYSLYTRFDGLSSSPNAFKFYVEGADGKLEEITQIPADPSQQIIVKTGETQSAPTYLTRHELRFATAAIEFAENLAVTLRIKAPALNEYGYSGYYLKATINGYTTTVTEYTEETDGRYKFVFSDIPPYLMAHDMDIVLYAKYGEEDVTALNLDYGIYSYARSRLDKSTNEDYKSVIVNMLYYGDAAQIYEGNYTELMATEAAGITADEQRLYATSDLRELYNKQNTEHTIIANPTASFKAVTLYFGSTVQIEYRFLPDTTLNPENLKVKLVNSANNHDWEFTYKDFVDAGNDENGNWKGYKITLDKLYANQMSDIILATVYDGDTPISNTFSYSIETYVSKKLSSNDPKFVALISTMMKYGDSVVNYSNSSN